MTRFEENIPSPRLPAERQDMRPDKEIDPVTRWRQCRENLSRRIGSLTPFQLSLHNNLVTSAKSLRISLLRTAFYLAAIKKQKIHRLLGFTSIADYARTSVGFSPKLTTELLRMAHKLPDYPLVAQALREDRLTWNQAREICTRSDPADQQKWLDAAVILPREALRQAMSSAAQPGQNAPDKAGRSGSRKKTDLPTPTLQPVPTPGEAPAWHFQTFRFTPEQKAKWDSLFARLSLRQQGPKEELLLHALHDAVLGSPTSTQGGAPPHLLVIMHCPSCGAAALPTCRGEAPVAHPLLQAALCDAVIEDEGGNRHATIPPRLRREALRRAAATLRTAP